MSVANTTDDMQAASEQGWERERPPRHYETVPDKEDVLHDMLAKGDFDTTAVVLTAASAAQFLDRDILVRPDQLRLLLDLSRGSLTKEAVLKLRNLHGTGLPIRVICSPLSDVFLLDNQVMVTKITDGELLVGQEPSTVRESLKWFEQTWDRSMPLPQADPELDGIENDIVLCRILGLAAGYTRKVLGISDRTYRSSRMPFGQMTDFALGVEVVRRGLVSHGAISPEIELDEEIIKGLRLLMSTLQTWEMIASGLTFSPRTSTRRLSDLKEALGVFDFFQLGLQIERFNLLPPAPEASDVGRVAVAPAASAPEISTQPTPELRHQGGRSKPQVSPIKPKKSPEVKPQPETVKLVERSVNLATKDFWLVKHLWEGYAGSRLARKVGQNERRLEINIKEVCDGLGAPSVFCLGKELAKRGCNIPFEPPELNRGRLKAHFSDFDKTLLALLLAGQSLEEAKQSPFLVRFGDNLDMHVTNFFRKIDARTEFQAGVRAHQLQLEEFLGP